MGEGKRKKVFVGNTGNRAEVTEEDKNAQSEMGEALRRIVGEAGRMMIPIGFDYAGSASVFYYKKDGLLGPEFVTACSTDVAKVEEQLADLGHKNLRTALMKAFGRTEATRE